MVGIWAESGTVPWLETGVGGGRGCYAYYYYYYYYYARLLYHKKQEKKRRLCLCRHPAWLLRLSCASANQRAKHADADSTDD